MRLLKPLSLTPKLSRMAWVIGGATTLIALRLFQLQVHLNEHFFSQGQKNFTRIEKSLPPRGNILDRNGTLLATNRPITNLSWQGTGNRRLSTQQQQEIKEIEALLNISLLENEEKLKNISFAERCYRKYPLAHDISYKQLGQIKERFPDNENLSIDNKFTRLYPYKNYASHLVGYLGHIELEHVGKMGLEKMFEPVLKGEHGTFLKEINSFGKQLARKELSQTNAGDDVQITIDIDIQHAIESVFPPDYAGTMIVLDPFDGDILALTSRPDFNPSLFLQPISPNSWQTLQENKPFLNRAFQACYPPGSIFKLVTIAAALEHNIITPETHWTCNGYMHFGKRKYWCHKRDGHGTLSTSQAVAQSCNILFYEIGKHISIDLLADYAQRFGLGQKTGLMFSEKSGLVPTTDWKYETFGERWWAGETLSATIGQSYLLTTPIQIGCMISSIMTGYRVQPRILLNEEKEITPLNISAETLDFLQQSMRAVVTKGTGQRVSKIKDFTVYAKTSTAQTSALTKRRLGKQYKEHGWFVAHISYKEQRPMTLVVLIENAGSARVATITARNFLIEYKKMIDSTQKKNPA